MTLPNSLLFTTSANNQPIDLITALQLMKEVKETKLWGVKFPVKREWWWTWKTLKLPKMGPEIIWIAWVDDLTPSMTYYDALCTYVGILGYNWHSMLQRGSLTWDDWCLHFLAVDLRREKSAKLHLTVQIFLPSFAPFFLLIMNSGSMNHSMVQLQGNHFESA